MFLAGRAFARRLIEAGLPGAVVNLASTAALQGGGDEPSAHYNASKAGVVALTRQMAIELPPYGIRVNGVCPGVIDTPMLRVMDDAEAGGAWVREAVPLARLGTAAEVASVIAFLLSDDASYVTGAALPIDGGLRPESPRSAGVLGHPGRDPAVPAGEQPDQAARDEDDDDQQDGAEDGRRASPGSRSGSSG